MSNSLAIASVTATIQGVVSRSGIKVTAQSPDKVKQDAGAGNRLNVFLFHTLPNAAWRNQDMIGQVKPGESGFPPLALNLHYLLTAYGTDDDNGDLDAQQVLGEAMRVLHDRTTLSREEIRNFARGRLQDTNLDQQIEQIRITHDPLSHEDLFRMWSTFNTPYRVSAAYQVSVVLIDSQQPTKAPPPVLRRGQQDRGVLTRLDTDPTLTGIEYRGKTDDPGLPATVVGKDILLYGTELPAAGIEVLVRDPQQRDQVLQRQDADVVARLTNIKKVSKDSIRVKLEDDQASWTSGMLSLEMQFPMMTEDSPTPAHRTTNALPLAIAPRLRIQPSTGKVLMSRSDQDGQEFLRLTTEESIQQSRKVYLILSERAPDAVPNDTNPIVAKLRSYQIEQHPDSGPFAPKFDISKVQRGTYRLRLRVGGVDSLMFRMNKQTEMFEFDPSFEVEL